MPGCQIDLGPAELDPGQKGQPPPDGHRQDRCRQFPWRLGNLGVPKHAWYCSWPCSNPAFVAAGALRVELSVPHSTKSVKSPRM